MTWQVVVLCLLAWMGSTPAVGAPHEPMRELYHQAWSLREGAPGAITGIAQTTDGYLWLATPAGLYRFDGVRFESRLPVAGAPLRVVSRVWAFEDGSLWALHDRGLLTVFAGGTRTTYTVADGLPASLSLDLVRDLNGDMWAAGRAGVVRLQAGRWMSAAADLAPLTNGPFDHALAVDRSGALWVGGVDRLAVQRPGAGHFTVTAAPGGVGRIAADWSGRLWATSGGIDAPPRLRVIAGPEVAGPAPAVSGRDVLFDRRGSLWIASSTEGVARIPSLASGAPSPVERFNHSDGLTRDEVFSLFLDREDNIWVGTSAGLDLFRETAVTIAPLPPMHAARMAAGRDGELWVGAVTHPLVQVRHGAVRATTVPDRVTAVTVDATGTVWAWASEALWRGGAGGFAQVTPAGNHGDNASSLARDRAGRLWGAFPRAGARILDGDHWVAPDVPGLPDGLGALRLVIADQSAQLWLAYDSGAVVRFDGVRAEVLQWGDGGSGGQLVGLAEAGTRTWLARRGGLVMVEGGRAHVIAGIDDTSVGAIRGIARHSDGSVWLNAHRGIVRLSAGELERAVANTDVVPRFRIFDYLDGAIGGAMPLPPQAAMATGDGHLWFTGFDAVLSIDPEHLPGPSAPPPVAVTTVRAGDRDFAATEGLRLPPGTSTVHIAYTGLSLTMPDRIRFRHRLDGVDDGWQEAGSRRDASYANLAPGRYTFRVIASDHNGVWPETGATTTFDVLPALYQTPAFRVGMVFLALLVAWNAFRFRVRQVAGQLRAGLEGRVTERERIARELHDTLLQSVQGLILRFQAVATRLPVDDPIARSMEETLARADEVLAEGRARLTDLRRSTEASIDLDRAIEMLGARLLDGTGVTFTSTVEGAPRPLHPVVRDEAYWIAHEAVANAARHAAARRIEAEVSFAPDGLRVRCRDDGRGLAQDPGIGDRSEHFGLRGMRERALKVGGQLHVWSRPGAGTEVELQVPAALAYARPAAARWSWRGLAAGGVQR